MIRAFFICAGYRPRYGGKLPQFFGPFCRDPYLAERLRRRRCFPDDRLEKLSAGTESLLQFQSSYKSFPPVTFPVLPGYSVQLPLHFSSALPSTSFMKCHMPNVSLGSILCLRPDQFKSSFPEDVKPNVDGVRCIGTGEEPQQLPVKSAFVKVKSEKSFANVKSFGFSIDEILA